jgi:hypothetical protein
MEVMIFSSRTLLRLTRMRKSLVPNDRGKYTFRVRESDDADLLVA